MHRDAFPSMHVKTAAHAAPHTPPSPHCAPHRALRIFLLNSSVIPLMGIFLCEIRKFYASSEKQAESCMTQINCIANWAAAPFFLCKPQQQIVWTKHTAALTRRVIHKRLTFTGVPLVFVSSKREGFLFQFEGVYTFQFKPCSKQSYINIIPWHAKSENGGNRWCQMPSFSERFAVLHHYSGSKQENLLSGSELICP